MTLRYLTAGESHGPALTAILEGMPAGLALTEETIAADLARRQTGAGAGGRMAIEKDRAVILAGVMEGLTTGAPIALQITNLDHANWKGREVPAYTIPRPGHADLAAALKYGYEDIRPSLERASARETAARVAAGADHAEQLGRLRGMDGKACGRGQCDRQRLDCDAEQRADDGYNNRCGHARCDERDADRQRKGGQQHERAGNRAQRPQAPAPLPYPHPDGYQFRSHTSITQGSSASISR